MANHQENEEAMLIDYVDISFDISEQSLDFLAISDEQEDFQALSSTFLDDLSLEVGEEVTDLPQCDERNQNQEVDTLSRSPDRGNEQDSGIQVDGVKDPLHTSSTEHRSSAPTMDVGTQACPVPAIPSASSPSSTLATKILAKMEELNKNLLVVNSRLAAVEDHSRGIAAAKERVQKKKTTKVWTYVQTVGR